MKYRALAIVAVTAGWTVAAAGAAELLLVGAKTRTTLKGHTSRVQSVAFSPDGKTVASASRDRTVKLWDAAAGTLRQSLAGHAGRVQCVAFSPDGKTLASADSGGEIKLWEVATGKELRTLSGHADAVNSVAFSPEGNRLASGAGDRTIKLWGVAEGKVLQTLSGHGYSVESVAFSPDGNTLVSGSQDATIKLWSAKTGQLQKTLTGHTGWLTCVTFSPDGKTLASSSNDGKIKLWDAATGQLRTTLTGHTLDVAFVAFSPDGKTLASGSKDRTVRLWDVASGTQRATLEGHTGWLCCVAFSPDKKTLASASSDTTIRLWDLEVAEVAVKPVAPPPPEPPGPVKVPAAKTATNAQGDKLTVLSFDPPLPAVLKLGERLNVRFSYTLASAESCLVWVHPYTNGSRTPGYSWRGSPRYEKGDGTAESWFRFQAPARIDQVRFEMVTGEGRSQALALTADADARWQTGPGSPAVVTPTEPGPPSTAPGEDYALLFNGRDTFVELPSLRYDGTHPITVEALVTPISENPTNVPGVPHLRGRVGSILGDKESGGINLAVTANGFESQVRGSAGYVTASCQQRPFGQGRMHVASVFDLKSVRIYVNGKLATQAAFSGRFQPSALPFVIGADPDRTQRTEAEFRGTVDEVRISRTARYAADFEPAQRFVTDGNTLGLYHFDEGQGLVAHDASSRGNHGRIRGAQWVKADAPAPAVAAQALPGGVPALVATKAAATLFGHTDRIYCARFSPDGKTLASAGSDATIRFWNVPDGRQRATLSEHVGTVCSVAFSPDGNTLASGGEDRSIRLWDTKTGRVRLTLAGHTARVWSVAFSPDGKTLASGGGDQTVRLWDMATGRVQTTLSGHTETVGSVAFSPDGKTVASGGWDRTIRLWDATSGQPWATLQGHTTSVHAMAFSPDGKTLASGSNNGTIKLWDCSSNQQLLTLSGHAAIVCHLAFSPDGKTLASSSGDRTTRFWDPTTGQPQALLAGHADIVHGVAFAPDGKTLATASRDKTVKLWTLPIAPSSTPPAESAPANAVGEFPVTLPIGSGEIRCVQFLPDGKTLVSVGPERVIRLLDAESGKTRAGITGHANKVWAIAVSPDGKTLASAGRIIKLWDVASRREQVSIQGHTGEIRRVAFSPDGKTLASACRDNSVRLWYVASGTQRLAFEGHTQGVYAVAFSPDGKTLASAGSDKAIKLWDAETGEEQSSLQGHTARIRAVAFSPDGKMLASCDQGGAVKLWDLEKGQERTPLSGHAAKLYFVAFSPDGKTLASVGDDQTIKLWDVASGKQSATLYGHTGGLLYVSFSPDGKQLATSGKDGTVRLWDLGALERMAARYQVPEGGVDQLLKFLEGLQAFRPATLTESGLHQGKAAAAAKAAAEKILELEKDESSKAYRAAAMVVLKDRVATLADAKPEVQQKTLADLKTHLAARVKEGLALEDALLATSVARALEAGGSDALAAEAYTALAKLFAQGKDEGLSALSASFEGAARRMTLIGKELELTGTKIDGMPFDWAAYRGKVVLIDFCSTRSPAWQTELYNVRKNYYLYHDAGFEVVRLPADADRQALVEFLQNERPAWGATLHERTARGNHPLAEHYGVTDFPTALLVDKTGKVVSSRAHGKELDRQLEKLLGPAFTHQGKLTFLDLQPKANRKLLESHGSAGNDLRELPQGEQSFAGVKFKIGDGLIQLASRSLPQAPEKAEGIEVNQTLAKLYILQGAEWAGVEVPENAFLGRYEVRYEDNSVETIYIVRGQDVRDWWDGLHSSPVSRGKVIWIGQNPAIKRENRMLRLYLGVWQNPQPGKKILSIDFISTNTTNASPFCVAITAEAGQ